VDICSDDGYSRAYTGVSSYDTQHEEVPLQPLHCYDRLHRLTAPLLLFHGNADKVAPAKQTLKVHDILQEQGHSDLQFVLYAGYGMCHGCEKFM
jgi:alpha-beta hydrolase superfamily lysophospholipase